MARKSVRKKSELDSALDEIGDESIKEFRERLNEAKTHPTELIRLNAKELERRLILLKKRIIDKEDCDFFVENQKRDLRAFVASQALHAQAAAKRLTLDLLNVAASKVVPMFSVAALEGDPHTRPPREDDALEGDPHTPLPRD